MSRADLLALTPEALASLANVGLVKRAQRELAAGAGPALEEDEAGVVTGRFSDGVVARLPPSTTLKDAPCSCGAVVVCRHRIAVALAYPAWHAATAGAPPVVEGSADGTWSPGTLTDELLARVLGKRVLERARAVVRSGVVVEVHRTAPPGARLPTCTVRFLVPHDLAYARCDCAVVSGCEHVAVAVWAFRAADEAKDVATVKTVELGARASAESGPGQAVDEALLLARDLLLLGIAELRPEWAPRFARARTSLAGAGLVWPLGLVDELEQAAEAYRARSARYHAGDVASMLAELSARARAARAGGELPSRFVLGADEAPETLLDHIRLISLGARVESDGRSREAEVYLADPDAGIVLVLRKRWDPTGDEAPLDGPALARRQVVSKVQLGALAHGQVVSKVVRRTANHAVTFGTSRTGQTSIAPQQGDWGILPDRILVRDLRAHEDARRREPPRMLQPRVLAGGLCAVAVHEAGAPFYLPGEQALVVEVRDAQGTALHLVERFRSVAPHAQDALAAAARTGLRFVSGEIRRGPLGLEMDPVGLVADAFVVPDLAASPVPWTAPHVARLPTREPLEEALADTWSALEEAAHLGLTHTRPAWAGRVRAAAERLESLGLTGLARRMRALGERARTQDAATANAWLDAAVRVELARGIA